MPPIPGVFTARPQSGDHCGGRRFDVCGLAASKVNREPSGAQGLGGLGPHTIPPKLCVHWHKVTIVELN